VSIIRKVVRLLAAGAGLAALVASHGLAAEETEQPEMEEIIVTATLRESSLMETPQAISAVSAEQIDALGATSMDDLFRNIAGLNATEGAAAGSKRYTIRGVGSQTGTDAFAQTFAAVSVYIDDTPMTAGGGPARQIAGNLFDIDRVEVLKGPQGTLFGEGSVGGTIRFIQNKPDVDSFDWKVKAGMDTRDESDDLGHRLDAMLNIPLSDNFAVRINGYTNERAGWVDKTDLGEDDVNSETSEGGRIAALWLASERLTVEAGIAISKTETEGGIATQRLYEDFLNIRQPGRDPFSKDETSIYTLDFDYEFDFATLQTSFSYLDRESVRETESALSNAAFFDSFVQLFVIFRGASNPLEVPTLVSEGWVINPDFATASNLFALNVNDTAESERTSFEAKLLSNGEGNLRWVAGIFVKESDDLRLAFQPFQLRPDFDSVSAPAINALYTDFFTDPANNNASTLEEVSVFGEATFAFLDDALEVTIGGRYTDMEQTLDDSDAKTTDKVFSPKLGISWVPREGLLTYFNVTTGFRPGNVNPGQEFNVRQLSAAGDNVIPANPFVANPDNLTGIEAAALAQSLIAFEGDSVVNYELGLKARLFDNRWNVTTSMYYFDWEDTILSFNQVNLPSLNKFYNDNAGAAHTQGIELELVGNITDNLRLRFGGDMNESELDEMAGVVPKGTDLPRAPEWSANATLDYTWNLLSGIAVNWMINHTRIASQLTNLGLPDRFPQTSRTDTRISVSSPNDTWQVSVFANNLTGEDEVVFDCSSFGNQVCFGNQAPRLIGLEFTFRPQQ